MYGFIVISKNTLYVCISLFGTLLPILSSYKTTNDSVFTHTEDQIQGQA